MRIYICPFLVLILFSSCKKESTIAIPIEPGRLVAWGALHPDSTAKVYLYESLPPLSDRTNGAYRVQDAVVVLYENGQALDTLSEIRAGTYQSSHAKPIAGNAYFVKAFKAGFPDLQTAPDTMPRKPVIRTLSTRFVPSPSDLNMGAAMVSVELRQPITTKLIGTRITPFNRPLSRHIVGWFKSEAVLCNSLPKLTMYYYFLEDYSCAPNTTTVSIQNSSAEISGLAQGVYCSVAFFSNRSIDLFEKIAIFHYYNTDIFSTDPFFEPVFIPLEAGGGYGLVSCYNTIDTLAKFKF
jgi:Domain of unknown function (DUF4249)